MLASLTMRGNCGESYIFLVANFGVSRFANRRAVELSCESSTRSTTSSKRWTNVFYTSITSLSTSVVDAFVAPLLLVGFVAVTIFKVILGLKLGKLLVKGLEFRRRH